MNPTLPDGLGNYIESQKESVVIDKTSLLAFQTATGTQDSTRVEWTLYDGKTRTGYSTMMTGGYLCGMHVKNYYAKINKGISYAQSFSPLI